MHSKTRLGLTVLAMLIGLSVLALYTTLVQDVLFKNVSFCSASTIELTFKVLALGTAGLVTGFLTSLVVLQDNYYPHIVLSVIVIARAFFFVECESMAGPIWYDALLTSVLISGLWAGHYGGVKFPLSPA